MFSRSAFTQLPFLGQPDTSALFGVVAWPDPLRLDEPDEVVYFNLGHGDPATAEFGSEVESVSLGIDALVRWEFDLSDLPEVMEFDIQGIELTFFQVIEGEEAWAFVPPFAWRELDNIIAFVAPSAAFDSVWCCQLDAEGGIETTQFTGFAFTRIVRINGRVFGARDGWIYEIGGGLDDGSPIACSATTPASAWGSEYIKRCPWVHFGSPGDVWFSAILGDSDAQLSYGPYPTTHRQGNSRRAALPQGVYNSFWSFKLENAEGSPFKVTWLHPDFVFTTRRI